MRKWLKMCGEMEIIKDGVKYYNIKKYALEQEISEDAIKVRRLKHANTEFELESLKKQMQKFLNEKGQK